MYQTCTKINSKMFPAFLAQGMYPFVCIHHCQNLPGNKENPNIKTILRFKYREVMKPFGE